MHRKRYAVPRKWTLGSKEETWAPGPRPGPHSSQDSVPLRLVLREMLEVAENAREAKRMVSEGLIEINEEVTRDDTLPVGLFDVVSVGEDDYRMLIDQKDRFFLKEVGDGDIRLEKVVGATTLKGGDRQMKLASGETLVGDVETGSTLVLRMPERDVQRTVGMEAGNLAFVTDGKHAGQLATIEEYEVVKSSSPNRVRLERDGETFATIEEYVFVVGEDEPEVEI